MLDNTRYYILYFPIVYFLNQGVSYRSYFKGIHIYTKDNIPSYSTIYKFFNKLIKYNIINITFYKLVNRYINKKKCNKFIIDSTFILNKYGVDNIGYNNNLVPKHKTSKVSLITDIKGKPLDMFLSKGNINDAKIIIDQLYSFINNVKLKNINNIFIGDAAYD